MNDGPAGQRRADPTNHHRNDADHPISAESRTWVMERATAVETEIKRVFIGAPNAVEALLVAMIAQGHVLLEGVPGVAKTTLAKTFASVLQCTFRRIQFTPDLLPSDITGTYILDMKTSEFVLRRGPVFAQVVLGDEINRAPAKTQSALLEAMQESQVTIEGVTQTLSRPFMVLATQNPVEQEGVYLLPEAQLDRFLIKLVLGYPSLDDEMKVLRTHGGEAPQVASVLSPDDVLEMVALSQKVHVAHELVSFIVRLVRYTRRHRHVLLGNSPRAAIALFRSSRARALIHGRDYVLPDDIRAMASIVLAHRVILTPDAELNGVQPQDIIQAGLREVPYDVVG